MDKCKYLILGAGPSGLSLANTLADRGENDFIVLEKEHEAGGLCRSKDVDSSPLDIGGGHFLDVRRPHVNEFLFRFLPEKEWDRYDRDSRIRINGMLISHPLEANIWQMDTDTQVEYLMSISRAGCVTGQPVPALFKAWIRWKLGDKITDDYMIPYNTKMFGDELDELGIYWLEKLPDVSFEDVLRSCLERRAHAKQPGHASFYYPHEYGYGELWRRMGDALKERLRLDSQVTSIDFDERVVTDSNGNSYKADYIITTIPWRSIKNFTGMPDKIKADISKLKNTGVVISYSDENIDTEAHWIYEPDPEKSYHRILVRHNFCPDSKGYWKETRSERFTPAKDEIYFVNEYAYPLNTIDKPEAIASIKEWAKSENVIALGRWGEHEHYNSDLVVERAMKLGAELS